MIGLRVTDWYSKDIQSNIKCQDLKYFIHNTTVIKDLNWDFKIFFCGATAEIRPKPGHY
jgi:hypothetical protein